MGDIGIELEAKLACTASELHFIAFASILPLGSASLLVGTAPALEAS